MLSSPGTQQKLPSFTTDYSLPIPEYVAPLSQFVRDVVAISVTVGPLPHQAPAERGSRLGGEGVTQEEQRLLLILAHVVWGGM